MFINSCIGSLPMFAMGFYLFPKGSHAAIDIFPSRFFWQGEADKQEYHMVKWADMYAERLGGPGIM